MWVEFPSFESTPIGSPMKHLSRRGKKEKELLFDFILSQVPANEHARNYSNTINVNLILSNHLATNVTFIL